MFLAQGKQAAMADVLTCQEQGSPKFEFRFTITKGQIEMQEGKMYLLDMLRHFDVHTDNIGSSRN